MWNWGNYYVLSKCDYFQIGCLNKQPIFIYVLFFVKYKIYFYESVKKLLYLFIKKYMYKPKIILFFAFIFCSSISISQVIRREGETQVILNLNEAIQPNSINRFDIRSHELNLSINNIRYDDIAGSPFWNDKFQLAFLYSHSKYVATVPVRINLATDEIYFAKNAEELVLDSGLIDKIVFKDVNDSFVFSNQINNLIVKGNPVKGFVQVLNPGKYQLIKYTHKKVASSELVSATGKKNYYFTTETYYFFTQGDKAEHIKKLNKENILSLLPSSSGFEKTSSKNKINFKDEKDVVFFLNYYNSRLNN